MSVVWCIAQKSPRWSIEYSYGPQANFFVDYDVPLVRVGGAIQPVEQVISTNHFQKKWLGTQTSIEVNYRINKSHFGIAYTRSINVGKHDFTHILPNGTYFQINDFNLRHINNIYQIHYKREFSPKFRIVAGVFLLSPQQQEIAIYNGVNLIEVDERNNTNANLNEAGVLLGADYYFIKTGNFELGLKANIYTLVSYFDLEQISLTPALRYSF